MAGHYCPDVWSTAVEVWFYLADDLVAVNVDTKQFFEVPHEPSRGCEEPVAAFA